MLLLRIYLLLFFWCACFLSALPGQDSEPSPMSIFEHLTQKEGATVHLDLDLEALLQNRKKADYLDAKLTDESGQVFDVKVRTRGKFRRRRCEIPPIKLKFPKAGLLAAQMDTMNEVKLVVPCAGKAADEELIVREYLAYRMFESLSPEHCVRARLIRLNLKDKSKKRPQRMLAMLVEHEEEVSGRLRYGVVEEWGVKADQLHAEQTALAVLFQYLIGNTDWEIASCRNVMLLRPAPDDKIIPIPYDFDFAGIVAAPYASPNSECNVRTIRDRCLMNPGVDTEALQRALQIIVDAKPKMYAYCRNKFLSDAGADDMAKFLDSFFHAVSKSSEIPSRLEFVDK